MLKRSIYPGTWYSAGFMPQGQLRNLLGETFDIQAMPYQQGQMPSPPGQQNQQQVRG